MTRVTHRKSASRPVATQHRGKVMHVTLNRSFAQDVHEDGVSSYLQTLAQVAALEPLTVTQTLAALCQEWDRHGIRVDATEAERIAEQLADPRRVGLIVDDDDGHRLLGDGCEVAESVYDDGYHEPQDPHRPFYS